MIDAWLGRYAAPETIARTGAFHRHSTRRADGTRVVVVSAAPTANEAEAQVALQKLARAHVAVAHPHVARSAAEEPSLDEGIWHLALVSGATIDAATALERLVDARARFGFAEAGALLLAVVGALRAAAAATDGPHRLGRLTLSSLLIGPEGQLELLGLGHPVASTDERGRVSTSETIFQSSEVAAGGAPTARGDRLAVAALRRALLPHVELPASLALAMRGEEDGVAARALAELVRALESDAALDAEDELGAAARLLERGHELVGIEPDAEGLRRILSDLALGLPIQSDWTLSSADLTEEVTLVGAAGDWIESPLHARARTELGPSLRRILFALLTQHRSAPERTCTTWELLEAGWPDEKVLPDAGANRVYAAIKRLRNMGLRAVIERRDDGYRIAPDARLVTIDS